MSHIGEANLENILRIYHECEGEIEKSIPRIIVWHREVFFFIPSSHTYWILFLAHH